MADFAKAYALLEAAEGGYSNDPDDAGGETWKGIARNHHPTWKGWLIIDSFKGQPDFIKQLRTNRHLELSVQDFYRKEFWNKIQGDLISNQRIAYELMDTAVNMGIGTAVTFAQRALNFMNRNGSLYPDMLDDGNMGPITLSRINYCMEVDLLIWIMNILQGARYLENARKTPRLEKFLRGWIEHRVKNQLLPVVK